MNPVNVTLVVIVCFLLCYQTEPFCPNVELGGVFLAFCTRSSFRVCNSDQSGDSALKRTVDVRSGSRAQIVTGPDTFSCFLRNAFTTFGLPRQSSG